MGPIDNPDTVVDTRLRVKGIAGLRVIDAGVMPAVRYLFSALCGACIGHHSPVA